MQHLKVHWKHSFVNEPVLLYSEIDDERWEIRKVEVFRDGRICFADSERWSPTTALSEAPLPSLDEIARDPQFEPLIIPASEFETVWASAISAEK